MHSIVSVFPLPVYVNQITALSEDNIEYIKHLDYTRNAGGNYTSDTSVLLEEPRFEYFKTEIEQNLKTYLEEIIAPATDVCLKITQSWVNKNPQSTSHHSHNHPNSIVSGVFYVCPESIASICFEHLSKDIIQVERKPIANMFNSSAAKIECKQNMLILFPSHLHHYVENNIFEDRISISFNTFYQGIVGHTKRLTSLELR
jgi:uncharacterized protein (TIGR02466 family)